MDSNEWLEATDLNQMRSAFKAVIISGLPNVRDYIHKDRENLMAERRQKLFNTELEGEDMEIDSTSTINDID